MVNPTKIASWSEVPDRDPVLEAVFQAGEAGDPVVGIVAQAVAVGLGRPPHPAAE